MPLKTHFLVLLFYTPFAFAGNCAVYAYVIDPDPAGLNGTRQLDMYRTIRRLVRFIIF